MNTANKITMSRIVISFIILFILLFPWHQVGIDIPSYIVNETIVIELNYIIAGVLFIIASCGKNNKFGHPNKSVVDTLNKYHIPIRRTDLEGTITYKQLSF